VSTQDYPEPVVVEDPPSWPTRDDPLERKLVRDDVVEQTVKRILDGIEKQFAHHVTRAEWREIIAKVKAGLRTEIPGEMEPQEEA
jgi:hypothetical protein